MIYKTLRRQLKIQQDESYLKPEVLQQIRRFCLNYDNCRIPIVTHNSRMRKRPDSDYDNYTYP